MERSACLIASIRGDGDASPSSPPSRSSVELALMFVARVAPAMAGLMRPAYVLVAVIAVLMIWQAWRRREGSDRRQDERRDPSPERLRDA